MSLARELEVAVATARTAAALVLAVYHRAGSALRVDDKGGGDPVTEADYAANAWIVSELRRAFPDDAICDEEGQTAAAARAAARGGRCWFVDPLDGTREFVGRSGEFAVMVGLALDGRPRLGVVCAPAWGRTFVGAADEAYELDDRGHRRPLRVTTAETAPRVVLSRLHRNAVVEAAAARLAAREVRECGSFGLKLLLVAAGEVDLFLHTGPGPKLWDGCAPQAIAEAAGATVSDAHGRRIDYHTDQLPLDQGMIVANPTLWQRALSTLIHQ